MIKSDIKFRVLQIIAHFSFHLQQMRRAATVCKCNNSNININSNSNNSYNYNGRHDNNKRNNNNNSSETHVLCDGVGGS